MEVDINYAIADGSQPRAPRMVYWDLHDRSIIADLVRFLLNKRMDAKRAKNDILSNIVKRSVNSLFGVLG